MKSILENAAIFSIFNVFAINNDRHLKIDPSFPFAVFNHLSSNRKLKLHRLSENQSSTYKGDQKHSYIEMQ